MKEFSQEAEQIMLERFGKDAIIALATTENGTPYVRYVNAYYEDSALYIIRYVLSNKVKHIKENCVIAEKLKKVFAEWIDNGHTDFDDENTIILRVELTDGLLFSHGTRYEL